MKKLHTLLWLLALPLGAMAAAPKACPCRPEDLGRALGVPFDVGVEEPGMGGTSCKYKARGSAKNHTDYALWVLMIGPGSDQGMVRKFTAGPGAKFVPVQGDPDAAERVLHDDGLSDVTYQRSGTGSSCAQARATSPTSRPVPHGPSNLTSRCSSCPACPESPLLSNFLRTHTHAVHSI